MSTALREIEPSAFAGRRSHSPPPAPASETPAGFEREALPHLDVLYRFALRLTGVPMQAEDLVQETMLRALRAWHQYRPGTSARAWLLTILNNLFINQYRRAVRMPLTYIEESDLGPQAEAEETTDPHGRYLSEIPDARVTRALDNLRPEYRAVLVRSDVEGMAYHEISQVLGVALGTVKSRIFRARRRVQADLYEYAVEMGYVRPPASAEPDGAQA